MADDNYDTKRDSELQQSEVESSVSIVGVSKKKKIVTLAIILLAGGLIYYLYSDTDKVQKEQKQDINKLIEESEQVPQEIFPPIVVPNQLPELPPIVIPSIIPSLPSPVLEKPKLPKMSESVGQIPIPPKSTIAPQVSQLPLGTSGYSRERRGTQMLVMSENRSSSSSSNEGSDNKKKGIVLRTIQKTAATQSSATSMGQLNFMIAQGKIIDAVLETSVNTDLTGMIRAIISRDVYAEAGDIVLIPKGSRLIGQYSFDNQPGQRRIDITWNRIMLPHGVDIAVNSPGIDELGRQGLSAIVDDKIYDALISTILLAGVSFGTAYSVSQIREANQAITIVTDPDGKQKTTAPLLAQTISQAVNDVSNSIKNIINRYTNTKPTAYIDQGTLVKIFVNQDIFFPPDAIKSTKIIQ
ncbi:TrbI/VirB10 family protein [Candidatus Mesenet endosymbiont of Agriotes lineatus]|uniref:TrbI/VirB10 family protein n=1 Tax=Candidatus Mesenet endosymbiont of Agriotes lineatus TaxID=3077948 RepID=UPI0030CB26F3